MEAMAAGLPAIGTRARAAPRTSPRPARACCWSPPDDHRALARTIADVFAGDPACAPRRGRRATVERSFTWERCGPRPSTPTSRCGGRANGGDEAGTHDEAAVTRCTGTSPDLLLLSLGTTRGLRVADAAFLEQVRAAGGRGEGGRCRDRPARPPAPRPTRSTTWSRRAPRARATAVAVKTPRPRAVVFSTVTASLMAPRLDVPYAVRFDPPSILNRPGTATPPCTRSSARRWPARGCCCPWSRRRRHALPPWRAAASCCRPPSCRRREEPLEARARRVGYAPDPKAKGLEVLCGAWERAGIRDRPPGRVRDRARARAAPPGTRTETPEPRNVEWRGMTPAEDFRGALRRSLAYVTARPAGRTSARRRWRRSPTARCLSPCRRAARTRGSRSRASSRPSWRRDRRRGRAGNLAQSGVRHDLRGRHAYRARAAGMLAAYQPETLERTVRDEVLPVLLG